MLATMMEVAGLTGADLAKLTGKHVVSVSRWLNGHAEAPQYAKTIVETWPCLNAETKRRLLGEPVKKPGKASRSDVRKRGWALPLLAEKVLKKHPGLSYTRYGLAAAIVETGEADVSAQAIFKNYMIVIIGELAHCYDIESQRFQYKRK